MKVQRVLEYDSFFCDKCRNYVYDEKSGDPNRGIEPLTRVEDLSRNWLCPICGATSSFLRATTLTDNFVQNATNVDCTAQPALTQITTQIQNQTARHSTEARKKYQQR